MRTLVAMTLIVGGGFISYLLFKNPKIVHGEWIIAGFIPVAGVALLLIEPRSTSDRDVSSD